MPCLPHVEMGRTPRPFAPSPFAPPPSHPCCATVVNRSSRVAMRLRSAAPPVTAGTPNASQGSAARREGRNQMSFRGAKRRGISPCVFPRHSQSEIPHFARNDGVQILAKKGGCCNAEFRFSETLRLVFEPPRKAAELKNNSALPYSRRPFHRGCTRDCSYTGLDRVTLFGDDPLMLAVALPILLDGARRDFSGGPERRYDPHALRVL